MSSKLLIGCAAGFAQDRTDAGIPVLDTLIERSMPAVLVFEMLAERTLAIAQFDRRRDPRKGYATMMEPMIRPVLRKAIEHSIPIVSNFGSANPEAAAIRIQEIAQEVGLPPVKIAVIEGDDLLNAAGREMLARCLDGPIEAADCISANAYLGAEPIAAALRAGAQVVVGGRIADPSLFVGPAMAYFDWHPEDWNRLARATMAGHLLECGAQVSGGYFADPPLKHVPELHRVGFPIAEIDADGLALITKADRTGGAVTERTVKEQLLYEVHDPAAYLTPDVTADITNAEVRAVGPNRVAVEGVVGHQRPETLKATVCYLGGWLGEGEISYAGPNAEARARLAADIVRRRAADDLDLRFDFIGVLSVFGDDAGVAQSHRVPGTANDVRLRVAGSHRERETVEQLLREITALYTCGPAGGGGIRTSIRQRLHSVSCYVPREFVPATFRMVH